LRAACSTLARRSIEVQGVSVPALRRARLPVAVVLIFSNWVQPSAASPSGGEIQRLPVIEKQDIRFEALSVGGKPFQKRVFALAQDNYGFLWLGTDDGLYRYDGYNLRHYSHEPGNPHSLTENTVMRIYKDRAGILWIGTASGGLDRFDPAGVDKRTRELKFARDAADSANRAKSSFLAHMSHELRTPLNAILGFSRLLRESDVSEAQRKDLDIINRSGEHLLTLIDNVLDLAKIESGRSELNIQFCDLKQLLRDVTDMIGVRARQKDLELRLNDSGEFPCSVRTDANKLSQVLINLLGNAVKFTEKGFVELRLNSKTAPKTETAPC
jgi:signal transduction histidine kinase